MHAAAESLIPSTVELGGKSPNLFFEDVMEQEDSFVDKCLEGAALAFFNQGEVCTCPSRLLVQESIADEFLSRLVERIGGIRQGDPFDTDTQLGAQISFEQYEKILGYIETGRKEGADVLAIANDTVYGLGAGVWTRDTNRAYRVGRGLQAGRVWTNCYHVYPAHAAFGGYERSGVGRENHEMMLSRYRRTKNLLVSYSTQPLGFFRCVRRTPLRPAGRAPGAARCDSSRPARHGSIPMSDDFPPDVAAGIVEHMNDDHADAVLAIARAQGGVPDATSARLLGITPRALEIEVSRAGGESHTVVAMEPPVAPLDTVRMRLVQMTREARQALGAVG